LLILRRCAGDDAGSEDTTRLERAIHALVQALWQKRSAVAAASNGADDDAVRESMLITVGSIGCVVDPASQRQLLWMLVQHLVAPALSIRAVAYDQLTRIAKAAK